MKQINYKKSLSTIIIYFLVAMIHITFFSWSTVPFFHAWNERLIDSCAFQSIGNFLSQGLLPYTDFFDHKGPINMFIQWFAYSLNSHIGLYFLQIINMTISLLGIHCMFRLYFSKKKSFCYTFIILLLLQMSFIAGNTAEEWCLPYLIWSFYLIIKHFRNCEENQFLHKPLYSYLYGITFAFCAFMRLTNALPLCCMILIGIYVLLRNKLWNNIFKNMISFILGVITITLPIVVWFASHGILKDMLFSTFIYNMKYLSNYSVDFSHLIKALSLYFLPLLAALIISLLHIVSSKHASRNCYASYGLLLVSIIALIFQLKSRPYEHYFAIWIPAYALTLILLDQMMQQKNLLTRSLCSIIGTICAFGIIISTVISIKCTVYLLTNDTSAPYEKAEEQLLSQINESDFDAIFAYNVHPKIYVDTKIIPCYRNFMLQDFQCQYDQEMSDSFYQDLKSLKAKYIIINQDFPNKFDNFLSSHYFVKDENQYFILLERNADSSPSESD